MVRNNKVLRRAGSVAYGRRLNQQIKLTGKRDWKEPAESTSEIHKEVKKRKTKHKVRGPDDGHGSYPATGYTGMKRMLPDRDE